jgi:hypothetical protein
VWIYIPTGLQYIAAEAASRERNVLWKYDAFVREEPQVTGVWCAVCLILCGVSAKEVIISSKISVTSICILAIDVTSVY